MRNQKFKFTKEELQENKETRHLSQDEVMFALQQMDQDNGNIAHFGVNGFFIFCEFDADLETVH